MTKITELSIWTTGISDHYAVGKQKLEKIELMNDYKFRLIFSDCIVVVGGFAFKYKLKKESNDTKRKTDI